MVAALTATNLPPASSMCVWLRNVPVCSLILRSFSRVSRRSCCSSWLLSIAASFEIGVMIRIADRVNEPKWPLALPHLHRRLRIPALLHELAAQGPDRIRRRDDDAKSAAAVAANHPRIDRPLHAKMYHISWDA